MQEFTYQLIENNTFCVSGYQGDEAHVVIPDRVNGAPVTVLFDKLFRGHSEIQSVKIPDTVTDLGEFVFDGCMNLRRIELPPQLVCLWGNTFTRCGIEEITLPNKLTALPPFAFKECRNLKKVICGAGMRKIHAWAFSGCDHLTEVVHGKNVEIDPEAFQTHIPS
ncbi:MAG: leucine-rich repeat domain-containing protein [Clostridiales bacterium]|nr:leucine-rich repeat domain-containing protein [Clostridiales bacterium]